MKSIRFTPTVNSTISRYIIPAIILFHFAITITLANIENVWLDEAFSLHTTQYGIGHAINRALTFEEQPPVYFALLNLWRKIDTSYAFARLFSALCIVLTLLLLAAMSKKGIADVHPGWITAVAAVNPFIIAAATELRCYALVILMATALCYFFGDGYLSEHPSEMARWLYALFAVMALYTFYFLGFLLVANACALLVLKRWRALRTYLLTMLGVALCFAPLAWIVAYHVSRNIDTAKGALTFWDGLMWVGRTILFYTVLIHSDNTSLLFTLARIATVCVAVGVIAYGFETQGRLRIPPHALAYAAIVAVIVFAHAGVVTFLGAPSLMYRYLLYLFPPLLLGIFFGCSSMIGKKGVIVCAIIMLSLGIAGTLAKFPRIKLGDWARAASYLMNSEQPQQPIFVYSSSAALPFAFHYSGKNTIVPLPREMNLETYRLEYDWGRTEEIEIAQTFSRMLRNRQSFWVVTDTFGHQLFIDFIRQKYHIVTIKEFEGSTVRFVQTTR